jgi:hypothetical protein
MVGNLEPWRASRLEDFTQDYHRVRSGRTLAGDWSVHNNKSIVSGDRLFLLRQRVEPKGIIASAVATGIPFPAKNWAGEKGTTNYVPIIFDAIVDAESEAILTLDKIQRGALRHVNWNTRRGGIEVPPDAAALLERLWHQHLRVVVNAGRSMRSRLIRSVESSEGMPLSARGSMRP